MPRTPRNSHRKPGRPAKKAEAEEALRIVKKTGVSIEDAAKKVGINADTVHSHKAKAIALPPPRPSGPPLPAEKLAELASLEAQAKNEPTAPAGDLELVRRILDARNGAARAELDEGLVVAARGEAELTAWLARPVEAVEVGVDELAALGRGLDLAVEVMQRAEPGGPALRALREVASLGKSVAIVKSRRPPVDGPDEATRRILAARSQAIERIGLLTSASAQRFAAARAELDAWCATLGPIGAEFVKRVDAMLGGPT